MPDGIQTLVIPWPIGGENRESARVEQPPRTTPDSSNMVMWGRAGKQEGEVRTGLDFATPPLGYGNVTASPKEVQCQIQTFYYNSGVKKVCYVYVVGGTIYVYQANAGAQGPFVGTAITSGP